MSCQKKMHLSILESAAKCWGERIGWKGRLRKKVKCWREREREREEEGGKKRQRGPGFQISKAQTVKPPLNGNCLLNPRKRKHTPTYTIACECSQQTC